MEQVVVGEVGVRAAVVRAAVVRAVDADEYVAVRVMGCDMVARRTTTSLGNRGEHHTRQRKTAGSY